MKREDISDKFKWRKEDIFATVAEWDKELSRLNKEVVEVLKFKGKLCQLQSFLACMQLQQLLGERLEKLYCYASLTRDENLKATAGNGLRQRAEALLVNYSTLTAFVSPELSALSQAELDAYIAHPDLAEYSYFLKEIARNKKHILSDREERLLAMGGNVFHGFSNVFSMINNVDLPFPKVMIAGKRVTLTHGLYSEALQSAHQAERKHAFDGMYKAVSSLVNTTAATFSASVAKDNYLAAARGYDSAVCKSLSADDVPQEIYNKLVTCVGNNLKPVHDYVAFRKKALGLEQLHMYDLYTAIVPDVDYSVSYEQAYELVLQGLKPMGREYTELLQFAKDNRWIDVYETDCKRSGAYSMGVAGVHPYVLLNYSKTMHDIFTIAHEMGHAAHSYYSSREQTYINADYSIFVAEVASTVNEVLLLKHMLSQETDVNKKKFLLSYYLDMFRTTLFRQTMFAEFELLAHQAEQAGKPLTVESLSKTYFMLNKKYYGSAVIHDKAIKYEWARIPHFYSAFYVYKYSTGIISAVNIANAIFNGDNAVKEKYKKFLCAGGSKSPYDILKSAGVDLCTDEPYLVAMKEFENTLSQLKELF